MNPLDAVATLSQVRPFSEWPPVSGPSGSAVVESVVTENCPCDEHRWGPPAPPAREVPVFGDDDDIVEWRALSDHEFKEAMRIYQERRAEYERTGGILLTRRPTEYSAKVRCADGSSAEATGDGAFWRWVSYER